MTQDTNRAQHVYLVRHGQTALNAEGRLRGLANPPLDGIGLAEAKALAGVLAAKGPVRVVSSPLARAARTAGIIAEAAGVGCSVDERFNDRDYGPQTGNIKAEVIAQWGTVDDAPGVEPLEDVLARARPELDALLDGPEGDPVIVVTHDAVIRPLIAELDSTKTGLEVPTGSWNDLVRVGGVWSVLAVDQKPRG
ncbi:histidine phosphatase family protein [Microbacterium sp. STN6]|uniref:histidine phosphatase family protein n=1 Tax=Microbacterium sp. STN6 TaxID=2995588 RepID=UPI002260F80C|nr:histidine phosphatase family protein [Microbacterium sp. STN6]MCX7520862.1 histidine phosphatase family protein [Microbacterium sp. STN6]